MVEAAEKQRVQVTAHELRIVVDTLKLSLCVDTLRATASAADGACRPTTSGFVEIKLNRPPHAPTPEDTCVHLPLELSQVELVGCMQRDPCRVLLTHPVPGTRS